MKKNVLLVEDARDIQLLVRTAIGDRVNLTCVDNTQRASEELRSGKFALMLLDVNLPDANGFDFCRRLRSEDEFAELPIFFLTGEGETEHKIVGFNAGGDDYLTKPFDPLELEARVMAKLSRKKATKENIQVDGYRVDLVQHKVFQKQASGEEEALPLTPLEFRLLSLFLRNEGKIFPRQELLRLFWGDAVYVSRNTVDTHISSLRKKMGDDGSSIKSVFKKGYSFARKGSTLKPQAAAASEEQPATKQPHAH
jgi:DNA-binding response OmpR family regulator